MVADEVIKVIFVHVYQSELIFLVTKHYIVVKKVIQKNFPNLESIPPHSRFRHFNASQLAKLTGSWKCDGIERVCS